MIIKRALLHEGSSWENKFARQPDHHSACCNAEQDKKEEEKQQQKNQSNPQNWKLPWHGF